MNRLTERTGEGQAIPCMDLKNNGHQKCMERLAEYEDFEEIFRSKMTDDACDFLNDKEEFAKWIDRNKWITKKCDEYARAEEQGKLLKPPCTVGDTVYVVDTDERLSDKGIKAYDINNIVITSDGTILLKYDYHDGVICELENIITDKPYLDFYRCFLSQEEAKAALKEL